MERIWQTLFRRKKKKYATPEPEAGEAGDSGRGDKQSVENLGPISDDPQRVTVKTAGGTNSDKIDINKFYKYLGLSCSKSILQLLEKTRRFREAIFTDLRLTILAPPCRDGKGTQ